MSSITMFNGVGERLSITVNSQSYGGIDGLDKFTWRELPPGWKEGHNEILVTFGSSPPITYDFDLPPNEAYYAVLVCKDKAVILSDGSYSSEVDPSSH